MLNLNCWIYVVTLDFNHNGEKIPVSFQLADKGSQWKIRNINVSGIDLQDCSSVTSLLQL